MVETGTPTNRPTLAGDPAVGPSVPLAVEKEGGGGCGQQSTCPTPAHGLHTVTPRARVDQRVTTICRRGGPSIVDHVALLVPLRLLGGQHVPAPRLEAPVRLGRSPLGDTGETGSYCDDQCDEKGGMDVWDNIQYVAKWEETRYVGQGRPRARADGRGSQDNVEMPRQWYSKGPEMTSPRSEPGPRERGSARYTKALHPGISGPGRHPRAHAGPISEFIFFDFFPRQMIRYHLPLCMASSSEPKDRNGGGRNRKRDRIMGATHKGRGEQGCWWEHLRSLYPSLRAAGVWA